MYLILLYFVVAIELPSVKLASFRFQVDRISDLGVTNPLHTAPPDSHSGTVEKQKPAFSVGASSNNSLQMLIKETVAGPASDLLLQHASKSSKADSVQDKVIQEIKHDKLNTRKVPVSVSERMPTSQMTTQISDEHYKNKTHIVKSTKPLQNITERNSTARQYTPLTQTIKNQNMVSKNILSHGESSPTIKSVNVIFRDGLSQSSPMQQEMFSSTSPDMKKSQERTSRNSSKDSSVKIIENTKKPKHDARRFPIRNRNIAREEQSKAQASHTKSTYAFYVLGKEPATRQVGEETELCSKYAKCIAFSWVDSKDQMANEAENQNKMKNNGTFRAQKLINNLPQSQAKRTTKFQVATITKASDYDDEFIFPEQYV